MRDTKSDICNIFSDRILGIELKAAQHSRAPRVNRSITAREAEFLQMINGIFERNTHRDIADNFAYASPNLEYHHSPGDSERKVVSERFADGAAYINSMIEGEPISADGSRQENVEDEFQTLLRVLSILFLFIENKEAQTENLIKKLEAQTENLIKKFLEDRAALVGALEAKAQMLEHEVLNKNQMLDEKSEVLRDAQNLALENSQKIRDLELELSKQIRVTDQLTKDLKRAWRDPIPHLFRAFGSKIGARRKRRDKT